MINYINGFYDIENDGVRNFRWMKKEAEIKINEKFFNDAYIKLDIAANEETELIISGNKKYILKLTIGWQTKYIPLDEINIDEEGIIKFETNFQLKNIKDARELSLMVSDLELIEKNNLPKIIFLKGFYNIENDGIRNFRWMEKKAELLIKDFNKDDCLVMEVGISNELPVELNVGDKKVTLINGWQQLCFNLSELKIRNKKIKLITDYEIEIENDSRKLSLMISNVSIRKGTNFEKNSQKLSEEVFKKYDVKSYPTFVTYETSARCNLKCAMCAVDESLNEFDKNREAGIEKTKDIYMRLLPYASKLQLHASGECLLGKDFWISLERAGCFANRHSMEIEIFTNGLLLNEENRKRIINSALTDIVISIDAAKEETYKKIRGGNFNLLLNNIRKLVEEINLSENKRLKVIMAFVMMRENINELPDFIKLAHSLGVKIVSFWPLFSSGIDMPIKKKNNFVFYYKQQMLNFYPNLTKKMVRDSYNLSKKLGVRIGLTPCFEKEYSLTTEKDFQYPLSIESFDKKLKNETKEKVIDNKKNLYKYCYLPWNTAFITTEGNFAPCLLLMYKGGIDNVIGKDFSKIWNSDLMMELRRSIIDGKVHPLCKGASCIFANED